VKLEIPVVIGTIALMLAGSGAIAQDEPAARSNGSPRDGADLTGSWILDESASDDPAAVIRDASSHSGAAGGKLKRVFGGVSVLGIPVGSLPLPSGASSAEPPDPEESAGQAAYTLEAVHEIRILQQRDATEFDYDHRALVSYQHGVAVETSDATVEADWHHDGFVIEHDLDDGTKIVETYRLDDVRQELDWKVRFKARKADAIEIERVYYREKAPGANLTSVTGG
jgi:hypothetical protein